MLADSLSGVRVMDFTQLAAGPICTMLLGDMGADIIKIESPQGDLARKLGPPWANGESVTFIAMNRNKRSMAIDLKKPGAVPLLLRLAESTDVVIESFRPGVMDRLGIGYEQLRRVKLDLVYCAITAYGQEGPWRDKPGVDGVLQAVSGLMSVTGEDGSAPSKAQTPTVDMVTGFLAVSAVVAALRQRDRTGVGQMLDVNMYASSLMLQQTSIASYLHTLTVPKRSGSAAPYAAPNEAFHARDGYMMVAAYDPDRWLKLCKAVNRLDLADDPRFVDNSSRVANRDSLVEILNECFCRETRDYWVAKLEDEDIICSSVCDYSEVVNSPQVVHNELLVEMEHPIAGHILLPGFALGSSPKCAGIQRRAPLHGEHTEEILDELGINASEIDALVADRVVLSINPQLHNDEFLEPIEANTLLRTD